VWFGRRDPHLLPATAGGDLVELPIGVLPGLRLPFIGTSLAPFGEVGWLAMRPALASTSWLNLECHAIDLCDLAEDALPAALRVQPEQRVPLATRWARLVRVVEALRQHHRVETLAHWAATLRPQPEE
jgi:hypothetical protein